MDIRLDDLRGPEIAALLQEHLDHRQRPRFGFVSCGSFADCVKDPYGVFMMREF